MREHKRERMKDIQIKVFGSVFVFAASKEIVGLTEQWRKDYSLLGTATMRIVE